jgi:hypothetical protein
MAEEPEIEFGMPEGGNNAGNAPNGGGNDDPNAHARARGAWTHQPTSYTGGDGRALQERGARLTSASRIPLGVGRDRKRREVVSERGHSKGRYELRHGA